MRSSADSVADRVCAELEDPAFETYPRRLRQEIRAACQAEREVEGREAALRLSDDDGPDYEVPEPGGEPEYDYDYEPPDPPVPGD